MTVLDAEGVDREVGDALLRLRLRWTWRVSGEGENVPCAVSRADQADLGGFDLEALDEDLSLEEEGTHLHADVDDCSGNEWFGAELRIIGYGEILCVYGAGERRHAKVSQLHLTPQHSCQLIFDERFEGVDVHGVDVQN